MPRAPNVSGSGKHTTSPGLAANEISGAILRQRSPIRVSSDVLSARQQLPLCPRFQTYRCLAANRNKQLRGCAPSEGRPTKTTRPPTKAISSWRYYRFQHFGWLGPPHIGQSAPACCAVSTFALQLMILQSATPFCLQFWIKSASACAWVASAKSLCSYPRLSLPSVPFIPHPQPAQAPVTVAAVSAPAMPRPKTIFLIDIALLNASDGTMSSTTRMGN